MKVRTGALFFALVSLMPALPVWAAPTEVAVFSGGCFWGVEAVFERLKGVGDVVSGYTGGAAVNPSYDDVSTGFTGHAESVRVPYDPAVVSYETLLKVFFLVAHDPTQLNYQGPDHGTQYRSALWYATPAQKTAAEAAIRQLEKDKTYPDKVVTEVKPLGKFWPAEDYHQNFIANNPTQGYIVRFDLPKLRFLHKTYPALEKS